MTSYISSLFFSSISGYSHLPSFTGKLVAARGEVPGWKIREVFFNANYFARCEKFTSGFLLNSLVLTSAFHLALSYTFAIENRGKRITFIVIPMPAQYFPWARLAFTFVMGGWPAGLSDATGIAAAHAYEFLTEIYPRYQGGKNWIQTPTWVRNAFGDNKPQSRSGPSSVTRGYGTAYRPATGGVRDGGGGGSSSSSAWSSALGGAWGNRGPGRVLGSGD